jgi:hypothetical protein
VTQDYHPTQAKQLLHPIKLLPTMVPEAAASMHKQQLFGKDVRIPVYGMQLHDP